MSGFDEVGEQGFSLSVSHPDPFVLELNRFHNLLKGSSSPSPLPQPHSSTRLFEL